MRKTKKHHSLRKHAKAPPKGSAQTEGKIGWKSFVKWAHQSRFATQARVTELKGMGRDELTIIGTELGLANLIMSDENTIRAGIMRKEAKKRSKLPFGYSRRNVLRARKIKYTTHLVPRRATLTREKSSSYACIPT